MSQVCFWFFFHNFSSIFSVVCLGSHLAAVWCGVRLLVLLLLSCGDSKWLNVGDSLAYSKSDGASRRILPVRDLSSYNNPRVIGWRNSRNTHTQNPVCVDVYKYIYVYPLLGQYFCYCEMPRREGQQVNLHEMGMAQERANPGWRMSWGCPRSRLLRVGAERSAWHHRLLSR